MRPNWWDQRDTLIASGRGASTGPTLSSFSEITHSAPRRRILKIEQIVPPEAATSDASHFARLRSL